MPLSRDLIDRLPHVEGILNYLAPMPEKPMNLAYDPPPGVPRSTGVPEPHRMTIYDARPVAAQLSLDSEGLALFEHKSAMRDFYDGDELRRVYYPEAERLVAAASGAASCHAADGEGLRYRFRDRKIAARCPTEATAPTARWFLIPAITAEQPRLGAIAST
jgi:hypothetical protein